MQALEAHRAPGQVLILGDLKGDVHPPRPVSSLIRRELTVLGTWNSKIAPAGRSEWDMVIANISGRSAGRALISHALPLADAPATFRSSSPGVWSNKVLFAVSAEARGGGRAEPGGKPHAFIALAHDRRRFHEPSADAGDISMRSPGSASICGTDLRISRHGHFKIPAGSTRPGARGGRRCRPGRPRGDGYREGDRVSVTPNVGCGHCRFCRLGLNNMCPDYEAFGVSLDGGFEEYLRIPGFAVQRGNVFHLPERVSYAEAALVEPFSCCLRGQEAGCGAEDTVLIVGAGPIGAFNVMLAKLAGAKKIIVANRSQPRLDRMKESAPTC